MNKLWKPTSSGTSEIGGVDWKGALGAWDNLESCSSSVTLEENAFVRNCFKQRWLMKMSTLIT